MFLLFRLYLYFLEMTAISTFADSVPPLPVLVDSKLFFCLHNPGNASTLATAASRSESERFQPRRYRKFANAMFAYLSKYGDSILTTHCLRIIYRLFGLENRKMVNSMTDEFKSNKTWRLFAIAYRLDKLTGSSPGGFTFNEDFDTVQEKFWADIWEAYWGALFIEREMWNDGVEDLVGCLRYLVYLKFDALLDDFSTEPPLDFRSPTTLTKKTLGEDPGKELPFQITSDDFDVEEVTSHPAFAVKNDTGVLGTALR